MFNASLCRWLVIFCAGISLFTACQPENSTIDEQKETHYLRGRNRVSTQDYAGAIQEFEQALQVNPKSAAAHFELAWLQEEHMKNWAAAIYHYQKHLELKPDSEYAERARERMKACKLELARTEVLSPVTQDMQSQLHRLQTENMLLKSQVDALQAQLAARPVTQPTVEAPLVSNDPPVVQPEIIREAPPQQRQSVSQPVVQRPPPSKKYTVKRGDTIFSIAKANRLTVSTLLRANPQVEPSRLKVGATLVIPPP